MDGSQSTGDLFAESTALTVVGQSTGGEAFSPDYTKRIETLCAHRDKALELYAQAYDINQLAHAEKLKAAPFNVYSQGLKDPPFAKGAAIRHVMKAFDCLKVGGRLVAVMPWAIMWRTDELHTAFRAFMEKHKAEVHRLPDNSFKDAGTSVATVIVVINRNSRW